MIAAWSRLPVRTRLTLWYVALLVGSLLALGGLGLWAVERRLYADADELLLSRMAALQTEVDFERGRLVVDLASSPEAGVSDVTDGLGLVRVWDAGRRLVYQKEGQSGLPPTEPATLDAILGGRLANGYATVASAAGTRVRLYAEPVRARDRVVGVVQVGRSQAEIEAVLGQLRLLGAGGLLVAAAWAWCGGYFLAGRALAPVDRITRAAEWISADDLSRRLALALPDDELGRLAAAFDGMIERLDGAFRRQRQFTADASHELRTPLAIIRSQVEVALGRRREAAYDARVLGSVGEEVERLGHLTESLLVLARADTGASLALAPLDLEELVAEVGARVAPRARERGIELAVTLELVGAVRGDATWLTQVLLNLLDNALDHTPAGGKVRLAMRPAPGGVLLEVADTGEGISSEHLPHLFERFYRVDPARSRAAGGAGLGLAICEWVARAHGGRLEVASTLGRGSTFGVWLPAAPSSAAPDDADTVEVTRGRPAPVA